MEHVDALPVVGSNTSEDGRSALVPSSPSSIFHPLSSSSGSRTAIVARVPVVIRPGTMADVSSIDALQKAHSRELGFLPTKAIEGKIRLGQVLVAEAMEARIEDRGSKIENANERPSSASSSRSSILDLRSSSSSLAGYLIAADQYRKRDEVGYVTQLCVAPAYRRHLVAGQLLQAQFDRSAYGCRLYCCWCAQDLKANEFWEAMGFVPIAFRTGSRKKGKNGAPRTQIFWQKRVRADDEVTPYWYPSKTEGGEMREDRLAFPIMPGVGWRDVMPVALPETDLGNPSPAPQAVASPKRKKKPKPKVTIVKKRPGPPGGLWFAHQMVEEEIVDEMPEETETTVEAVVKPKVDKGLIAMARDLRDRWQEQMPQFKAVGGHDVRRIVGHATPADAVALKMLGEATPIDRAA